MFGGELDKRGFRGWLALLTFRWCLKGHGLIFLALPILGFGFRFPLWLVLSMIYLCLLMVQMLWEWKSKLGSDDIYGFLLSYFSGVNGMLSFHFGFASANLYIYLTWMFPLVGFSPTVYFSFLLGVGWHMIVGCRSANIVEMPISCCDAAVPFVLVIVVLLINDR